MNCEYCSNGTELSLMNAMCGIEMGTARHSLDCRQWLGCAPTGLHKPAWGNAPGCSWPRICFRALKGRNRTVCAALSGLVDLLMMFTQGVALGWLVGAPSGRLNLRPQVSLRCSIRLAFVALLVCVSIVRATDSRLADAAEKSDRATIRTLLKQHAAVNAPQV